MNEPITTLDTRHGVPRAGVTPWEETHRVLETAELFWLSTVRADGRPHVTPLVAVWHDGAIHFTATDTAQKTVNLRGNPHVILTTGCNQKEGLTVVVEGDAVRITDQDALLPRSLGVGDQVGWKLAIPGTQRVFLPLR
jgi:predicted pyridoxine 5'-phosphate oxidase superfamily flavin-nucleotide-binding protein